MTLEEAKEILQSNDTLIEASKLKEAKEIATRAIDKQIELINSAVSNFYACGNEECDPTDFMIQEAWDKYKSFFKKEIF